MTRRILFDETVLNKSLSETKEILEYLRKKRYDLISLTKVNLEEHKMWLKKLNLDSYINFSLPVYDIESLDTNFFLCMRRMCDFNNYKSLLLIPNVFYAPPAYHTLFESSECVFISSNKISCEKARVEGWQSILYEDEENKDLLGRKIKSIGTLKSIY